jgi:hypothetical protein
MATVSSMFDELCKLMDYFVYIQDTLALQNFAFRSFSCKTATKRLFIKRAFCAFILG